jgi:hypothetical protein
MRLNDGSDHIRSGESEDAQEQIDHSEDLVESADVTVGASETDVQRNRRSHQMDDIVKRRQMHPRQIAFEKSSDTSQRQNNTQNFANISGHKFLLG